FLRLPLCHARRAPELPGTCGPCGLRGSGEELPLRRCADAQSLPHVIIGSSRLSARVFRATSCGQLIAGVLDVGIIGTLAGQLRERPLDLAPDTADRDPEYALAALQEVDHLVGRTTLVHAGTVAHQRDLGEVVGATRAQMLHGGADLLQRDP